LCLKKSLNDEERGGNCLLDKKNLTVLLTGNLYKVVSEKKCIRILTSWYWQFNDDMNNMLDLYLLCQTFCISLYFSDARQSPNTDNDGD